MNHSAAVKHLKKGGKVRMRGQKGYFELEKKGNEEYLWFNADIGLIIHAEFGWKEVNSDEWEIVE